MYGRLSSIFTVILLLIPTCLLQETPVYGEEFRKRYEDGFLDPPELIEKYGYHSEEYNVTTEDGYILVVHRIPYSETCGPKKGTVLFLHGLWETSSIWLLQGPGRSLPYLLSDDCYDVWLPNLRGNYYSKYHKSLSNEDTKFWEFTIQEVAVYDVPAIMKHITNITEEEMFFFIGLAYGNSVLYVLLAEMPDYNSKVRLHISFGPVASLTNSYWKSFYFILSYLNTPLSVLGVNEIAPKTTWNYIFAERMCQPNTMRQTFCMTALLWIAGYNYEQVNKTMLPVYACHFPAGISRNIFIQYGQSVRYGSLRKFDYGMLGNLRKYGASNPPEYYWGNITAPSIFYQGDRDIVTTPTDSRKIYEELRNGVEYKIFPTFIHQDFAIGVDSTEKVYIPLLKIMKTF